MFSNDEEDGDENDIEQNVESRAAMAMYNDPEICSNPNVTRALQGKFDLTRAVSVNGKENATNMTVSIAKMQKENAGTKRKTVMLASARKSIQPWMRSSSQSDIDRTPSRGSFMRYTNSGSRVNWNNLNSLPKLVVSPQPIVELLAVRMRKRVFQLAHNPETAPKTKKMALLIQRVLSEDNEHRFTSAIEDSSAKFCRMH